MMNQFEKSRPPVNRPTTGMMMSLTSESTILPNAPPMITPTARSTTLPFNANSRNSDMNDMLFSSAGRRGRRAGHARCLHRRFARFAGADAHGLFDIGHDDLA